MMCHKVHWKAIVMSTCEFRFDLQYFGQHRCLVIHKAPVALHVVVTTEAIERTYIVNE